MVIKLRNITVDVADRLETLGEALSNRYPGLQALWLFGSYARGDATPLSDVDLAYLPAQSLTGPEIETLDRALYLNISRALETDEITLVNLSEAPIPLAFSVLREGTMLFALAEPFDLKERVLTQYPDAKRLRREILQDFEASLRGMRMSIDREKVLTQLRLLGADVEKLKQKMVLTEDEYLNDGDSQIIVERKFQTAIESCVNIGNHLISRLNLKLAEDYASVFQVLAEANVVPAQFAESMADMARFRNLLVHLYWGIDHRKVHQTMKERIETLESFSRAVFAFLEK